MTVDAPAPGAAPAFSRIEKLAAVGVVGVLALALGLVALLTPASTSRSAQLHFAQSGHFGYSAHVPTGPGLLAFSTPDEAVAALDAVRADHGAACEHARAVAERCFRAEDVCARLLADAGL